jgi:hypothetical protein
MDWWLGSLLERSNRLGDGRLCNGRAVFRGQKGMFNAFLDDHEGIETRNFYMKCRQTSRIGLGHGISPLRCGTVSSRV